MKKKVREILEGVVIESVAAEGRSIAKVNGKVLFVPFAIPGDIADIEIHRKKSGWMEGVIKKIITPSPDRIEPFCSHYGVCGGCKWQPLPYPLQLKYKQQQVEDQLKRIGGLSLPDVLPIMGSENTIEYRNKLEFTFSNKRWVNSLSEAENLSEIERYGVGFHIAGMFDKVLDITKCYLQKEPSNDLRNYIKDFAIDNNYSFFDLREQKGLLRTLIIRTSSIGEVMVIQVFSHYDKDKINRLMSSIISTFPQITSLNYVINEKRNDTISDLEVVNYHGRDCIFEEMEGLRFRIGPKSFYQTNSQQAYRLYSVVREFASLTGNEILYDLYTGTGTIALFLASQVSKVVGVECVPEAIEDAKINASLNNISNSVFYAGDMKDVISDSFIEINGKPDVIVLDPPRAGVHPDVINVIVKVRPSKIIYVSCNPATQARDISFMKDSYTVKKVQPVDMFPHTHHLENVVLLELI
ncbi:MAG: 23S rRNA (uracil(1939)-C(5))-methyltransferase RlmD [Bacteroidales bacterium]|jgi:23S rRNA (uracil1939-C5)-methyltransferase|nr:23S rRNA (uracil(1939)-C(5))-methyltransferase RlmD [Bacteroidales bacterium]MDD3272733.1 23S rRNA (uracil(1939)-C(5))-methyltransferase RlmD [Bacteroidales bacterium]